MKYFFHSILVLLVTHVCFAQQQYTFTNYTEAKVVGKTSIQDRRHIALATVYKADVLVSWNFDTL